MTQLGYDYLQRTDKPIPYDAKSGAASGAFMLAYVKPLRGVGERVHGDESQLGMGTAGGGCELRP